MMCFPRIVYFQFLLLVFWAVGSVSAAPTPRSSSHGPPEPGYVSEPTQRGTLRLFWNCVSTFLLCVWTAIHPDVVPVKRKGAINFYKFFLMTWAIIIPELVVCMAVEQWKRARDIRDKWEEKFCDDEEIKNWLGLPGAFFVVMGGYVVEQRYTEVGNPVRPSSPASDIIGHPRRSKHLKDMSRDERKLVTTIGAKGFEELLERNVIKDLITQGILGKHHFDQTLIEDKGNANTISKLLVAIQISWMVIQSIGRKATGLPVTLLEVHVLIQIVYSIFAFCCWWEKPLDINNPIELRIDPKHIESKDGQHDMTKPTREHKRDLAFYTEYEGHCGWYHMFFRAAYTVLKYLSLEFLNLKIEFWASVLAVINGGLHLTVWNSYFPSTVERIMWRVSGIGLGVFPFLVYFIMFWSKDFDDHFITLWYKMRFKSDNWFKMTSEGFSEMMRIYRKSVREVENSIIPPWVRFALLGVCTVSMLLYVACIVFLTVEAFISMRSLPAGAYSQPSWTAVFPHI